jgi:sigma-B regulation protein RsbU (phosphoserine phosphatase)
VALGEIARLDSVAEMLEQILGKLLGGFEDELGFAGGRIYERRGSDFFLCCGFGVSRNAPVGLRVPPDYPPHLRVLADGIVLMRRGDRGFDEEFEAAIGAGATFAAIGIGPEVTHVIAFSIKGEVREEQILYSLTAIRHVVNLKLEQQRVAGMLEESRLVHESLLPAAPPHFPGWDIDARARALDILGGDLFDYVPASDRRLGITIADASGHGLAAALLVRDVITGLRMAAGGTQAVDALITRLNRTIHRTGLATKFVSLFYAELEPEGALTYCNAGHNPPLLQRGGRFSELAQGGTVLGPIPSARYEQAREHLRAGDTVVLYTDGIVERENRRGEQFGLERLRACLQDSGSASATATVAAVLGAVDDFGRGAPVLDDMTVLVARKL